MKLTKTQLKQIIKEEIATTLQEWEPGTSLVPGSASPESGLTRFREVDPGAPSAAEFAEQVKAAAKELGPEETKKIFQANIPKSSEEHDAEIADLNWAYDAARAIDSEG